MRPHRLRHLRPEALNRLVEKAARLGDMRQSGKQLAPASPVTWKFKFEIGNRIRKLPPLRHTTERHDIDHLVEHTIKIELQFQRCPIIEPDLAIRHQLLDAVIADDHQTAWYFPNVATHEPYDPPSLRS